MFDIHSHILFGVDDGCRTIEESIMMIKKAIEAGVTDLMLTPHYAVKRNYVVSKEELKNRFDKLQKEVSNLELDINLFLGNEIDEENNVINLIKEGVPLTLNNTKYVLVDFGMRKTEVDEVIYELKVAGYKPIVAHVERYRYIDGIDTINRWKRTGALIQVNAASLFGRKEEKKLAKLLIKKGIADIIASDAHRNPESFSYMKQAYEYVSKKVSKSYADIIFKYNPAQVKGSS